MNRAGWHLCHLEVEISAVAALLTLLGDIFIRALPR